MSEPKWHGTYWSVGEMQKLKAGMLSGMTVTQMAKKLHRSESAIDLRWRTIRTAEMFLNGDPKDTLKSYAEKLKKEAEEDGR